MRLPLLALTLLLAGCSARPPAAPDLSLVDPDRPASTETARWAYRRSLTADLDGDGAAEQILVLANVELDEAGEPVWDDGHGWEVVVVAADGTRTRLYARFLQLGRLAAELTSDGRALRLTEDTQQATTVYEVRYDGPGRVRVVEISLREYPGG